MAIEQPYTHVFDKFEDFLAHYRSTYCDFVYDQKSGLFYTDFQCEHVMFISDLYLQNGGKETGNHYENQDAFVLNGMGMFKSRAGNAIMCSQDFELPADWWFLRRDLARMGD